MRTLSRLTVAIVAGPPNGTLSTIPAWTHRTMLFQEAEVMEELPPSSLTSVCGLNHRIGRQEW